MENILRKILINVLDSPINNILLKIFMKALCWPWVLCKKLWLSSHDLASKAYFLRTMPVKKKNYRECLTSINNFIEWSENCIRLLLNYEVLLDDIVYEVDSTLLVSFSSEKMINLINRSRESMNNFKAFVSAYDLVLDSTGNKLQIKLKGEDTILSEESNKEILGTYKKLLEDLIDGIINVKCFCNIVGYNTERYLQYAHGTEYSAKLLLSIVTVMLSDNLDDNVRKCLLNNVQVKRAITGGSNLQLT